MGYDEDFAEWAHNQAALLRAGRLSELDIENVAEELETLARGEVRTLRSAVCGLLEHLVMLECSTALDRRVTWKTFVVRQRAAIADVLEDSPSLRSKLPELMAASWGHARRLAMLGMGRRGGAPDAPTSNPFTLEQLLDDAFFPGEGSR